MSNIEKYLSDISNAVYGRDVRSAIHDGIAECYADVTNAETVADAAAANANLKAGLADTAAVNANAKAALADTAASNAIAATANAEEKAGLADVAAVNANVKAGLADAAALSANAAAANVTTTIGLAETATSNANAAATNADEKAGLANAAAVLANTKAGLADVAASSANATALYANEKADLADAKAALADTAALNANSAAANANTKAGLADTAASNASTAADNANVKAGLAETATTNASTAASNANAKAGLADAAALNANAKAALADTAALNADAAAANADTKAALADEKAVLASTKAGLADVAASNANAAATGADVAAANADTKASLAETATSNANAAASSANSAANNANTKAGLADVAASNANVAASNANGKAGLADSAADAANAAANAIENIQVGATTLSAGSNATVSVDKLNDGFSIQFGLPKGLDGTSFIVLGLYSSLSALQTAHPSAALGDAYAVGTTDANSIYIWNGSWINIGPINGPPGSDGSDGTTFRPSVNASGVISWTNDGGLLNPTPINIRGPVGAGLIEGGSEGQIPVKNSSDNYDMRWETPSASLLEIETPALLNAAIAAGDSLQEAVGKLQGQVNAKSPSAHASAANTHGIGTAALYGHVMASSATPLPGGTATAGTDNGKYAREGHVHPVQTTVAGNAGTATALATPRNIGVTGGAIGTPQAFDGTKDISIPITSLDASKLSAGTIPDARIANALRKPIVIGTQSVAGSAWTGTADTLTALDDGQCITYYLPVESAANVTLDLTLAGGSGTGPIPVYFSGTVRMGTQYEASSLFTLIFRVGGIGSIMTPGWWAMDLYDSKPIPRYLDVGTVAAAEAVHRYKVLAMDSTGAFRPFVPVRKDSTTALGGAFAASTQTFNPFSPIVYYSETDTVGAGIAFAARQGASVDVRYGITESTLVANKPLFLKGVINAGGYFTLDSAGWTVQDPPAIDDGKYYWYLGWMTSSTVCKLYLHNPMLFFKNEKLGSFSYQYETMSVIEGTNAIASTPRTVRADYLKQIIQAHVPTAETDPTVPAWAKATTKPSYSPSEVGAVPTTRTVNGKALSSDIQLTASDVGAAVPTQTVALVLTSDGWVDTVQVLTHVAIRAGSNGSVQITQGASMEEYVALAAAMPQVIAQGDGSITVRANGDIPEINVPVEVVIQS